MSFKANLMWLMVLGLSSHVAATDSHGASPCPASCVKTVTVTSTASCTESASTSQTSTTAYLETYTNAGPYVNASSTQSSADPYTTEATSTVDASSTPASNITNTYTPPSYPVYTIKTSDALSTATQSGSSASSGKSAHPTAKPNRCHRNKCLRQRSQLRSDNSVPTFGATPVREMRNGTNSLFEIRAAHWANCVSIDIQARWAPGSMLRTHM